MTTIQKRHPIQQFGAYLGMVGGAVFIGIFVIVLLNGRWPDFLKPIQNLYGVISNWTGEAAIVIEMWLFIGPAALIYYWGKSLGERQKIIGIG